MKTRKQKILATGIAAIMLSSCSAPILAENTTSTVAATEASTTETITLTAGALTAEYKTKDLDTDYDSSATRIECGSSVNISGSGASESDGVITISAAGTYVLSGSYKGQLVIEATKDDYVHLIFNGFEIESSSGPAVYATECDKLTITLADGTVNTITDSENYTFAEDDEDQEPDAALFSEDDMSINGNGTLNVTGNYADAIKCKKDLKLISGTYNITAVSEGIKGRNSVTVKDGTYNITSGDTAIKVTRDDDAEKGYVIIDGGEITINAGNDGIHAETHLTINGGDIDIQNASEGIEGQMIDVTGGNINVIASDDAFNASRIGGSSNKGGMGGFGGGMRQQGETGTTGDASQKQGQKNGSTDASTDTQMQQRGQKNGSADASTDTQIQQGGMRGGRGGMNGDMNGMPPMGDMNGGTGGDMNGMPPMGGMNGDMGGMRGGHGGMRGDMNGMPGDMGGQRPDMNGESTDGTADNRTMRGGMGGGMNGGGMSRDDGQVYLNISGGTITAVGGADCLDSNGSISLTGGTIYASSPRNGITGPDAVLDADGAVTLGEGVTFIGTGTGSSMSLTNEQNSLYIYEDSQQSAGTNITLKDSSGSVIASYTPSCSFTGIAITAPEIKTGETYTLTVGGNETSVTVSDKETTIGTASAGGMGGGFGGGMRDGKTYTDVDSSSSYSGAVTALSRMGAMNGTSDTTFSPDESLTRGMAITVLGRMSRAQESTDASDFDDVEPDAYYAGYVTWAQDSGIVQGYGNGKFGVNDYITAKQLQTIIERYAKSAGFEYTADENASDEPITRGEFAEVLFNAIASMMNSARVQ